MTSTPRPWRPRPACSSAVTISRPFARRNASHSPRQDARPLCRFAPGPGIRLEVKARSFLHNQVRSMAAVEVCRGRQVDGRTISRPHSRHATAPAVARSRQRPVSIWHGSTMPTARGPRSERRGVGAHPRSEAVGDHGEEFPAASPDYRGRRPVADQRSICRCAGDEGPLRRARPAPDRLPSSGRMVRKAVISTPAARSFTGGHIGSGVNKLCPFGVACARRLLLSIRVPVTRGWWR